MSPEAEICHFVVALVDVLRPKRVIETGAGQGFVSRRVKGVLRDGQRLTCYESDPTWRQALRSLAFFDGSQCLIAHDDTPEDDEMASTDLCILDSDFPYRLSEIERWWRAAGEGAVLFVHDAGHGHGQETPHALVRSKLLELGIPGFFLGNPRGAFVGVKPLLGSAWSERKRSRAGRTARSC
jgi:predicted O-methyltransferase YrrM